MNVQAAADVAAGATSSYATTTAVYRYYKVQIISKVNGAHGAATVVGVMK